MAFLTIDVVLLLPGELHRAALAASAFMVARMAANDRPSAFQLGRPLPANGTVASIGAGTVDGALEGVCEPHVSLFMLRLPEGDVPTLLGALQAVAEGPQAVPPVPARGHAWSHNPQGAPELYFEPSPEWTAVQQAVVAAAEPLRHGLRDADPSGAHPAEVIERLRRDDPDGGQLAQLNRYGYDEITDDVASRFRPHVTVAWPSCDYRVDLHGLSPVADWCGELSRLGVFGMGPNGTCVQPFGSLELTRTRSAVRYHG